MLRAPSRNFLQLFAYAPAAAARAAGLNVRQGLLQEIGYPAGGFDAITLANMAKVRAERNENLLAVSLGEAALELAREHLPEHVAEILANLAEAYAEMQMLQRANACLDEADESLNRGSTQAARTSPMALFSVQLARGR